MSERWLLVGLGNPGAKYANTRHNVGQMVVDALAESLGESFSSHPRNARVSEAWLRPGGPKVVLVKPNSFMNLSGGPVAGLADYFQIPPERIIVFHDDLDLPFDSVKLKQGGGHGGHNGLRDIQKALDSPDFLRVRIGVGRPPGNQDPAAYVLAPFNATEKRTLDVLIQDATDAGVKIVEDGLLAAQQEFHGKSRP